VFKLSRRKHVGEDRLESPPHVQVTVTTVDVTKMRQRLTDAVTWAILIGIPALGFAVLVQKVPRGLVSLYLFGAFEPSALGLELAALTGAWLLLRFEPRAKKNSLIIVLPLNAMTVPILAAGTTVCVAIAHFAVYHDHALAVDEFMTRFGAATITRGDFLARIPEEWRRFSLALQPTFTFFSPGYEFWGNPYRPVNAAIVALFGVVLHAGWLANAALAGLSVFLIARIAAHVWPERKDAPLVAALLMTSSAQVLANGMTYYAMPAHLAFNLAWLLFFLRGGGCGHVTAATIGVLAVGLHEINFHPLFVIPFLVPVLLSRRWPLAIFYGVVYAAALLFWLDWFQIALWWSGFTVVQAQGTGGDEFVPHLLAYISTPGLTTMVLMLTNFVRFISWQSALALPLAMVGLCAWKKAPAVVRQGTWGLILSAAPFFFILPDQGHGWGYRYLHGLIGNLVLLGVFGWIQLVPRPDVIARKFVIPLVMLTAASILLIGLRCVQINSFVEPYATALGYIRAQDVNVVVVDSAQIWFGSDLTQNDPYLRNNPKIMSLTEITEAEVPYLCQIGVRLIEPEDLPELMPTLPFFQRFPSQYAFVRGQIAACSKAKS
jgi:hypothetical protein